MIGKKPGHAAVLAVLAIAAVLRAAILWRSGANLTADVDQYLGIARNIAAGEGFASPGTNIPTAFRPPLYPAMLAAIVALGGDLPAIGCVQFLLGVGAVALTMSLGMRLGLGRLSLVAGLLVALDPLLLHNTSLVMTETLATFLAALLLWFAVPLQTLCLSNSDKTSATAGNLRESSSPQPVLSGPLSAALTPPVAAEDSPPETPCANRRRLLLGIVFGLACLCRPTFFAFGGGAVLAAIGGRLQEAWRSRKSPPGRSGDFLRRFWPVALGASIVLAPWCVRNVFVFGQPILTTTHGGYTLLLGHNPVYYREVVNRPWGTVWGNASLRAWQASLEQQMAAATPPVRGEIARDRWFGDRAWQEMRSAPSNAAHAALTLAGRLWNVVPLGDQSRTLGSWGRAAIAGFYLCTFAAMLLGVTRLQRQEWRRWQLLALLIGSFTLVHLLYWADMRMRAPLTPCIALLAARGLKLPNRPSRRDASD